MTEQRTFEAPDLAVEQHARKYALQTLASTMLTLYGDAGEQAHSLVWSTDDRRYCLEGEGADTLLHTLSTVTAAAIRGIR